MNINTDEIIRKTIKTFDGSDWIAPADNLFLRLDIFLKRQMDIALSIFGLLFFAPVFFIIAVLIKLSSRGPVFYQAVRIGKNQKSFYMFKFRTMSHDADLQLAKDMELKKTFELNYKLKDDSRVIRIGGFLRRTGLDEFPQLINIILGEMSLVGPRPILKEEMSKTYARERFAVSPGLTGLWQIKGKNDTSYSEKNELDRYYTRHRSLMMDLKILSCTIPAIIKGKGFY